MKFFNLFIILLLIFGCSSDKDTAEFEKVLGKENSETLTYLVNDFESDFLKKQYPDLSTKNAYRRFLTELTNGKVNQIKNVSKKSRNRFEQSNLKSEIYSYVDSVWIENDFIIKQRFPHKSHDGVIGYNTVTSHSEYIPNGFDQDSLFAAKKNSRVLNHLGRYWAAFDSIKERNDFMKEYYKIKTIMGILNPKTVEDMLLNSHIDFSDYYIKRIIIIDYVY